MKFFCIAFALITVAARAQPGSRFAMPARSSGKLTMLAYGLGEDRLGGAKMGYIDTGVLLKIIDSTKELYLVQLSKLHNTYVNKKDVRYDSVTRIKSFYLTSSFSAKGDELYDEVNISLEEKLPYKSWMELNPSSIKINIYGATSNTNWITQLKSVKEVKNLYLNQVEDDVTQVTIELKHKQHWGYSISYIGKTLNIRVRRQPTTLKASRLLVAVDAGHGGSNEGATGITTKALEKNYTIRFANELQKLLKKKGVEIIMTRTNDTDFNNVDRVKMLQALMPDVLISLHLNSSSNANVQGVSTYYKDVGFRSLSTSLLSRMLQLNLNEFGNVGSFNFTLNAPTDFPNALVEIAFLSNIEDEKKIINPRFHKAVAKKIYRGLKDWLKHIKHQ